MNDARSPLRSMSLALASYPVRDVVFGERTRLAGTTLEIERAALLGVAGAGASVLASVEVDLARPGARTRIIHVIDALEPRWKQAPAGAPAFPGFLGPAEVTGTGRTHRLDGVAVLTTGNIPGAEGSQGLKEAIVDMTGPAAELTPVGRLVNVVLRFEVAPGIPVPEALHAIRLAGLRVATWLAETTRTLAPASVETLTLGPADPALPRVVYIAPMMREGAVHTTFIYGMPVESLPLVLHPNEVLDGGVVTADYWIACHRIPTYLYQNEPVVRALYARHGRDVNFVAVLACRSLVTSEPEKRRQAAQVAKVAAMLGADGAVITMSNGGHAYADQMLICQAVERAGIKTVLGVDEYSDTDGSDVPLVIYVPEAEAIVSCGNQEVLIDLPPMERLLGGERFVAGNLQEKAFTQHPAEALTVAIRQLYAATAQVGAGRLTSRAF
ncbi:MAG: glycine reductase [Candidatus Rokubacteria bacterium]|nr:glycine reductase [Candidatus Rokubacteria bacterium]